MTQVQALTSCDRFNLSFLAGVMIMLGVGASAMAYLSPVLFQNYFWMTWNWGTFSFLTGAYCLWVLGFRQDAVMIAAASTIHIWGYYLVGWVLMITAGWVFMF